MSTDGGTGDTPGGSGGDGKVIRVDVQAYLKMQSELAEALKERDALTDECEGWAAKARDLLTTIADLRAKLPAEPARGETT